MQVDRETECRNASQRIGFKNDDVSIVASLIIPNVFLKKSIDNDIAALELEISGMI